MIVRHTEDIRKKPPIRCGLHQQRCHIVGLNLVKQLLNYYAEKRRLIVSETELKQWTRDLDQASNFYCCSPERNTRDKYTEEEVLHMLLGEDMERVRKHGPWPAKPDQLSREAREMYEALKALMHVIQNNLSAQGRPSPVVSSILEDLESSRLPLRLYCFECSGVSVSYREDGGTRLFCDGDCQRMFHLSTASLP